MIKFDADVHKAAALAAQKYQVPVAALLAVIQVESGGKIYASVAGRNEPLIRFEGHYFYKRVADLARDEAVRKGLANPKAGAVKNPNGQAARWALIDRAAKIDKQAAYESTSWGIGQVMGAHWKWLGYSSVLDLVNTARRGVDGQIELMVRYIDKAELLPALRSRRWAAFARGYNGPAYKKQGYHTKLAEAYSSWESRVPVSLPVAPASAPIPAPKQDAPPAPATPPVAKQGDDLGIPDLDKPLMRMTTIWSAFAALLASVTKTFADLPPLASYALLAVIIGGIGWMVRERLRRRDQQKALAAKAGG